MLDIIFSNSFFWFSFFITLGTIIILFILKKEINLVEAIGLIICSFIILTISYNIYFHSTYKIVDKENLNGTVNKFILYEEWKELVHYTVSVYDGTDSDGNAKYRTEWRTRIDYHPEYWVAETSFGTYNIEKQYFVKATSEFGSKKIELNRSDQVSHGDGNAYVSIPNKVIPTSIKNDYYNWVRASKYTVLKKKGMDNLVSNYISNLIKFPDLTTGEYGTPYFYRIINFSSLSNLERIEKELSELCGEHGKSKQIDLILYIVENKNKEFIEALKNYWEGAKKNNSVIIINLNDKTDIVWSDSISWTKNGQYINNLKNINIKNLKNTNSQNKLIGLIKENIINNWKRVSMKEFEYLKGDLIMPLKNQITIMIINFVLLTLLSIYFLLNDFDK